MAYGFLYGPIYGFAYALTFGLATGLAIAFGKTHPPSRINVRFRGNQRTLLVRVAASVAVGITLTPVAGPIIGISAAAVFTLMLATHLWLGTPPDATTASSPTHTLKQDRAAALTLGAVVFLASGTVGGMIPGPVIGPAYGLRYSGVQDLISVVISAVIGLTMGGFLYGRTGAVAFGIAGAITGELVAQGTLGQASGIAFGLIIGSLSVLSRSWGAFAVTRLWLALFGYLPLRIMQFLDDAHQRGLLRQSGTVYQFRHERLYHHIATRSAPAVPARLRAKRQYVIHPQSRPRGRAATAVDGSACSK